MYDKFNSAPYNAIYIVSKYTQQFDLKSFPSMIFA
jgi:hypothetical protein